MGNSGGWREAIEGYCTSLRAQGRSRHTLRLRRWQLEWLAEQVRVGPAVVTLADLEAALSDDRWATETRRSRVSAAKSFYRWATRAGWVSDDPTVLLASVPQDKPVPRPCPESVLAAALGVADARVRLMLILGAYGGLRASEIAQVSTADLDDDGWLTVHGKGGKVRRVPVVNAELLTAIRGAGGWLFPNGRGDHIAGGYVTRLVSRVLPEGWTCHTLRHRFGTVANARTHDLAAVQELLGHASPVTTRIYVLVPGDDLIAAVRAAA